nr:hypothetical protein [Salinicola tamaricis]
MRPGIERDPHAAIDRESPAEKDQEWATVMATGLLEQHVGDHAAAEQRHAGRTGYLVQHYLFYDSHFDSRDIRLSVMSSERT